MVFLAAPALYEWANTRAKNNLVLVLFAAGLVNAIAGIAQSFFLTDTLLGGTRPLGLVGDPITFTLILFIFFLTILLVEFPMWILIPATVLTGHAINIAGSVSACAASICALIAISLIFITTNSNISKNNIFKFFILIFFLSTSFFIPTKDDYNSVKYKSWVYARGKIHGNMGEEYHAINGGGNQHLFESMENGRQKSLKLTLDTINPSPPSNTTEKNYFTKYAAKLFFGDFTSSTYSRYDSTPAVLLINWGIWILILFYLTIIYTVGITIFKLFRHRQFQNYGSLYLSLFCCMSITACGFLNSIWYRSPINFILLLSLTSLLVSNSKTSNSSQS